MSETHCPKCNGKRGFCAKCGKPRRRRLRGDVGGGRRLRGDVGGGCCPYARVIPCRGHVETTYACDVCHAPNGPVRLMHLVAALYACEPCHKAWKEWQDTMRDRFIEDRQAARRGST